MSEVKSVLTKDQITTLEEKVVTMLKEENDEVAQVAIDELMNMQESQEKAAQSLINIVNQFLLPFDQSLDILSKIFNSYCNDIRMICLVAEALEAARDIDDLNSSPSESPLFKQLVQKLSFELKECGEEWRKYILSALATTTRLIGRQYDEMAYDTCKQLIAIDPEYPPYHYRFGLFCKTRGYFSEGMVANQKGLSLLEEPAESYLWNLGICATGARNGEVALDIWKKIGCKIELGRFDLPEGGFPDCKVKLAERPLAERNSTSDDPGLEETIWIERLSPCHGIIRSVLYQDLGVNYGDVILTDGAPITYHKYGDEKIAVFPHLSTLIKFNYQLYDFVAVQDEKNKIANISTSLERDSIVYVHTENYRVLCDECWNDENSDHTHHSDETKNIVAGKVAAHPDISPSVLLSQIDNALSGLTECKFYSPHLAELAGQKERAERETLVFNQLNELNQN
ncbi:prenyltransferase [Pleionea sediminis]|uniref:prenyltransferase n=1 Tax=Pleionea sediminis TaxID=2569479 RepID=UPI00118487DC|nr:prenyltransferase [Pleionea sediminis]